MPRTVSDWMIAQPPRVPRTTPLAACAKLLRVNQAQYLVVTHDDVLSGLLGDAEVFRRGALDGDRFVPHHPDDAELTAQQLTRVVEIEVGPQAALANALQALVDSVHDALVVVDEDRHPLGLLTEADAVSRAAPDLPDHATTAQAPLTVDTDRPADEVRSLMARRRLRHVLVLDGEQLHGVLSFRDVAVEDRIAQDATAGALATRLVHTAPEGVSLRRAAETLATHRIGCLPLVDTAQRPTGWITRSHVLAAWLAAQPQL